MMKLLSSPEVDRHAVDALKEAAERLERGEIVGITIVYMTKDNRIHTHHSWSDSLKEAGILAHALFDSLMTWRPAQ